MLEFWEIVVRDPILDMWLFPAFFAEVVIGGLTAGVMYSLVALGFVLIFKASGVFNFAQGVFALFQPISPLRQRMIEDMTMRKLAPKTQTSYIRAVKKLADYLGDGTTSNGYGNC